MTVESAPTTNRCESHVTAEPKQQDVIVNTVPLASLPDTGDTIFTPDDQEPLLSPPSVVLGEDKTIKTKKVPAMVKRLKTYNSEGLNEGIIAPENGGRPRRRQLE